MVLNYYLNQGVSRDIMHSFILQLATYKCLEHNFYFLFRNDGYLWDVMLHNFIISILISLLI